MKNILVTGGAGYIGSHTCIELMKADYNVIIVDDLVTTGATVSEAARVIYEAGAKEVVCLCIAKSEALQDKDHFFDIQNRGAFFDAPFYICGKNFR